LSFFASEIAIKDELFRNAANSREYQSQFAARNVCYQLKKVPTFRMLVNAFKTNALTALLKQQIRKKEYYRMRV
jgi:hypothetical protein